MDTGDARRNQQLREAALAGRRSQRDSVQQNLGARRAEQNAASAAFVQRAAQFLPRRFKLRGSAHVPKFIQAREFQQNVEASYEGPC